MRYIIVIVCVYVVGDELAVRVFINIHEAMIAVLEGEGNDFVTVFYRYHIQKRVE